MAVFGTGVAAVPDDLAAQTDFYNLDKDRPLRVEDAYTTKRYAFELQVSPLTMAQQRDGALRYAPAIELKHGLFPGFEISGSASALASRGDMNGAGTGELELSGLLNLTVETPSVPALGLRVTGHVPLGSDEHGSALEVKGIATRSLFGPVRAHVNGAGVFGEEAPERWWAGLALDYALPFHHTLLLAETYVADGTGEGRHVHSTAGVRYQLSPTLALDGGVGRTWSGDVGDDWSLTVGLTHEFGVRELMPLGRR